MMVVGGRDDMPLAHVITCGRELRGSEAFSPQALERVDLGQPLSPCRRAKGIEGQHEQLRVAIARPEIAQHVGEGFEVTPTPPGDGVDLPGQR
jgi:hypothetical protein